MSLASYQAAPPCTKKLLDVRAVVNIFDRDGELDENAPTPP